MIPIIADNEAHCLSRSVEALDRGKVIAYPTEAVYGLGCDPNNAQSVEAIYTLKERHANKGFILISHHWDIIAPWVSPLSASRMKTILGTWPGPITWILPASSLLPQHLSNADNTIAVRITAHPFSKALCHAFNKPLVSTSANKSGDPPCYTAQCIQDTFLEGIALIVDAPLGEQRCPTEIREGATGSILRSGKPTA